MPSLILGAIAAVILILSVALMTSVVGVWLLAIGVAICLIEYATSKWREIKGWSKN